MACAALAASATMVRPPSPVSLAQREERAQPGRLLPPFWQLTMMIIAVVSCSWSCSCCRWAVSNFGVHVTPPLFPPARIFLKVVWHDGIRSMGDELAHSPYHAEGPFSHIEPRARTASVDVSSISLLLLARGGGGGSRWAQWRRMVALR